ncbi:hypothetical protein C8R47DRAFT_1084922 [Mycena vitilis]|nr:hypothetical protein C8R47DRAFT_1084922 [Mycena vitilis]
MISGAQIMQTYEQNPRVRPLEVQKEVAEVYLRGTGGRSEVLEVEVEVSPFVHLPLSLGNPSYAGCKSSYNILASTEGVPRALKNVAWMRIDLKTRRAEMPKPGMSVIVSG